MSLVHRLAVVASAVGLPGFVKGLEVKDVNAPVEQRADSILVVLLSVVGAGLSLTVVGSAIYSMISTRSSLEARLDKTEGGSIPVGQPDSPLPNRIFLALSPATCSMRALAWAMSSKYVAVALEIS